MPVFFLVLALYFANAERALWVRCSLAMACAMLAMFSFASGVLVFALPLPVLLLCGRIP